MSRVILIDDEYWALKGMETLFPWASYAFDIVGSFDDSVQAMDAILALKPELVMTDIRMPELSGLHLMRMARERGIRSEFVIISGYGEFEYAREALQLGAFDYMLKPIAYPEAEALLARLSQHLHRASSSPDADIADLPTTNAHFNDLLRYVRANYQERLQLKDLAAMFFLNPTYCSELFNKTMGISFSKYVNKLRLDRCCRLLTSTVMRIEDIAMESGFSDYTHFHKVFKATLGMSPMQYRKKRELP